MVAGAELIVTADGVAPDSPEHYMNVPAVYTAAEPDKYFDIDQVVSTEWLRR